MQSFWSKKLFYLGSFAACGVMALSTGCASGGFKLTREYAQWVNSKTLILRIVLYLLTFVVFAVTLLIDMVIFNTMDFWDGKVSQGTYEFKDGNKTFYVKHEFLPETGLKQSTIDVKDEQARLLQNVVLKETPNHEVELYVDGQLRSRVRDIHSLPVANIYNEKGQLVKEDVGLVMPSVAL
ncbi:MAG TPA: DUF3332 family protein [Bdellovibrio sp.]|nr:DUF3332 family protein [Bdellovibrio sp.]